MASRFFNQTSKIVASQKNIHTVYPKHETAEECDNRYIKFFNRADIDGWDLRSGMTDLLGLDLVPDPKVIIAAMYACRRVNDYSLAVRFIEAVKDKCGDKVCEIYPYIIQEIAPVICELGVDTPEILGYDKPELWMEGVMEL
ncbi:cytochrome c oxidase polypeptide [Holotrichia oblita]|uniref:Cytochrome c oxidase polypeptide n=1 Tax=Holotrichia oblita TaxID=644536 RepID=A0ACB9TQT4_HOLOL|nr:cytochrome c oxidase polypeptide [Holotrichia oblita]